MPLSLIKHNINDIFQRSKLYCISWHLIWNTDMKVLAQEAYKDYIRFINTLEYYINNINGKEILEIGCGRLYPLTSLFHSTGYNIIGIDTEVIRGENPLNKLGYAITHSGIRSFIRQLPLQLAKQEHAYVEELEHLYKKPVIRDGLDIREINAENMPFPDNYFDIVISHSVWEHLKDVPKVTTELFRVLKPNGIAYIELGLFTGLSGSHHPFWNDSTKYPPWDHLRKQECPVNTYLNGLRLTDYVNIFEHYFVIIEIKKIDYGQGLDLLKENIRTELIDYTDEKLLTPTLGFVLRKI